MLSYRTHPEGELRMARAALARMPLFQGVPPEDFVLERLGTLTNVGFKVTVGGEAFALRLPGDGTSEYIDRAAEERNARIAATAGVGPEVLFFDERDGTMLCRFIEGVVMSAERFAEAPARAALALKSVHGLGEPFRGRFDAFADIEGYRKLLRKLGFPLPEGFRRLAREARAVRRALESSPVPLVPCHNDPWPGNFVDAGGEMRALDWEYSGMNDPLWDLADLSVEAAFTPEQDRTMMRAYFGRPSPALYPRLALYKVVSDLLWATWGLLQHASGNPQDDFLTYALQRFENCEARMQNPAFAAHLKTVRARRHAQAAEPRYRMRPGRETLPHEVPVDRTLPPATIA